MVSLKDRHWCIPRICSYCANQFCIGINSKEGCYTEYFCTLGLTEEDFKIIKDELNGDYMGLFPEGHEYSEPFKKVLGVAGSKDPYCIFDSERHTEADACCDKYEVTGLKVYGLTENDDEEC